MNILNKLGYDPIDDSAVTGYRRPPRDAACVCDYFATLMLIEDDGQFLHSEMRTMLEKPMVFFEGKRRSPPKRVTREHSR